MLIRTGLKGWTGNVTSGACAFISKPNEYSPSGSCIGPGQTVIGSGTVTRPIAQADLPSGVHWEGSGGPTGLMATEVDSMADTVVTQGTTQNQVDTTAQTAADTAQAAANAFVMPAGISEFLQGEAISGVPNWALVAAAAFFFMKDKL